ncbi:Hypothetical predicted protein [Mytilus galloprovincialis]|uniref:Uncharacterized protein n=1 Tax=Mytilus galloprovincialis TaxID=29158 RepID=A0A8B6HPH8_MYTGA|nr:Hypothetical predicted protein [Mytilus galloprovincialis]
MTRSSVTPSTMRSGSSRSLTAPSQMMTPSQAVDWPPHDTTECCNCRCGNRLRPGMFHSHEGRVAEATEENVCRDEEGLPFNLLFLQKTQDEVNESCNPTTGS